MLGIQHEAVGGIIGLISSSILYSQNHTLLAIGCFLVTIWGANLPDLLDPPLSPFHRSVGHNFVSFFLFLITSIIGLSLSLMFHWWPWIIATSFSFAVLSHLILDMTTPMGLPLFVGKSVFGVIEIPLYLIPFVNIIMVALTIVLSIYSIKYLAKKIGGIWALILLFIPVWGSLLLFGIALKSMALLSWLGSILISLFIVLILILILVGKKIDKSLNKRKK